MLLTVHSRVKYSLIFKDYLNQTNILLVILLLDMIYIIAAAFWKVV